MSYKLEDRAPSRPVFGGLFKFHDQFYNNINIIEDRALPTTWWNKNPDMVENSTCMPYLEEGILQLDKELGYFFKMWCDQGLWLKAFCAKCGTLHEAVGYSDWLPGHGSQRWEIWDQSWRYQGWHGCLMCWFKHFHVWLLTLKEPGSATVCSLASF